MRYYTSATKYNCGIDLHARQMYACLMDRQGNKLVHANITGNDFGYLLKRAGRIKGMTSGKPYGIFVLDLPRA